MPSPWSAGKGRASGTHCLVASSPASTTSRLGPWRKPPGPTGFFPKAQVYSSMPAAFKTYWNPGRNWGHLVFKHQEWEGVTRSCITFGSQSLEGNQDHLDSLVSLLWNRKPWGPPLGLPWCPRPSTQEMVQDSSRVWVPLAAPGCEDSRLLLGWGGHLGSGNPQPHSIDLM